MIVYPIYKGRLTGTISYLKFTVEEEDTVNAIMSLVLKALMEHESFIVTPSVVMIPLKIFSSSTTHEIIDFVAITDEEPTDL